MNLRRILFTGSLLFTFGACSVFSSPELKEEEIVRNVPVYRFNRVVASISGPFEKKEMENYNSFSEISEYEKIKFNPILYQIKDNKTLYLDCQRDGFFNGNEYPINELVSLLRESDVTHTPEQLCRAIGY